MCVIIKLLVCFGLHIVVSHQLLWLRSDVSADMFFVRVRAVNGAVHSLCSNRLLDRDMLRIHSRTHWREDCNYHDVAQLEGVTFYSINTASVHQQVLRSLPWWLRRRELTKTEKMGYLISEQNKWGKRVMCCRSAFSSQTDSWCVYMYGIKLLDWSFSKLSSHLKFFSFFFLFQTLQTSA